MKAKEGETARKREGACSGPGVVSRADVLRERVTRARGGGGGRGSLGETRSTRSGNLRRICSYLSARGAARFTDTLMPFKGTLPRVDSSALTDSLPPAVEFMEGEATTGFGVSRISPPRAFSPTSRAHPFSPFPSTPPPPLFLLPCPQKKKNTVLFLLFPVVFPLLRCPLHRD